MFLNVLTNKRTRANLLIATALLALPGCTGAPWEKSFWNPPAASGAAEITDGSNHPIQRATGENLSAEWPNLADVPHMAPNPLPEAAANSQLTQLDADRNAATARAHAAGAAANAAISSQVDIKVPTTTPLPPPEL